MEEMETGAMEMEVVQGRVAMAGPSYVKMSYARGIAKLTIARLVPEVEEKVWGDNPVKKEFPIHFFLIPSGNTWGSRKAQGVLVILGN